MASIPFDRASVPGEGRGGRPRRAGRRLRAAELGKGLAAFLLGLMLGVSCIVLGQAAFHEDDTPPTRAAGLPELRR